MYKNDVKSFEFSDKILFSHKIDLFIKSSEIQIVKKIKNPTKRRKLLINLSQPIFDFNIRIISLHLSPKKKQFMHFAKIIRKVIKEIEWKQKLNSVWKQISIKKNV